VLRQVRKRSVGTGAATHGILDPRHDGAVNRPQDPSRRASAEPDGARPDRARPDGARPDGARPDGARPDGARPVDALSVDALDRVLVDAAARLHGDGERMTHPRRVVLTALAAQRSHVTADALVEAVAALDARVHRASVYRTLEALTAHGVVQHIHMGHGPTAYHLVGALGEHLHAQCRSCGTIVDLPAALLDDVAARVRTGTGFVLDATHVAMSGQCAACAQSVTEGSTDSAGAP